MLDDKVLLELKDASNRTTQLWVVDNLGPSNSWNQDGLDVAKIGGTGSGDAILGGRLGWTKLFLSGAIFCQLRHLPMPAACRRGNTGEGLWDGGTTTLDRGVIEWHVLRIE